MKNPYDKIEHHPSEVTLSKRQSIIAVLIFIGIIAGVPIARHLSEFKKPPMERWLPIVELWNHPSEKAYNQLFDKRSKSDLISREEPNLRDHLQAFESGIKGSDFRKSIQTSEQGLLLKLFRKGNSKVIVGEANWLYYRPAIEALTGRGPLKPEPDSVTKDPDRPVWRDALPVIETFANQLKQRGVDLMIVPIPVKPMIQAEGLGVTGTMTHPDHNSFYQQLRQKEIYVVDLLPDFEKAKAHGDVFLRQDTHWKSSTAKLAAKRVSEQVSSFAWYQKAEKTLSPAFDIVNRSSRGDLVDMLGLAEGNSAFENEIESIERVFDSATQSTVEGDLLSPIAILGDSFVNIYEEPGLGFGDGSDGLIGGGFASHLSAYLKMNPNVMAINGEGATGVRQQFAGLPDNVVRSKKLVIWTIASRDFFLSESAANRAGVTWRDVTFNTESEDVVPAIDNKESRDFLILSGILKEKSAIEDPDTTPYKEALYSAVFADIKVESGEYYDSEAYVFLWAFKDRQLLPSANLKTGTRYQLKLIPMIKKPELSRKTLLDDLSRFDLDRLFAEEIE